MATSEHVRAAAERLLRSLDEQGECNATDVEVESLAREVLDLRATLTATEARLAEETKRADAAVAIAREWDADFQRSVSEGCNVSAVKDRRARLATLTGEG